MHIARGDRNFLRAYEKSLKNLTILQPVAFFKLATKQNSRLLQHEDRRLSGHAKKGLR